MSITVGLLLIAVFVAFATLMSLERLSAVLALPLMAVVFLATAVAADLIQPAQVTTTVTTHTTDAFGRRHTATTQATQPARFAQFRAYLDTQRRLLHNKAQLQAAAATELAAAAQQGRDAYRATLRTQRTALDQLLRTADETLAAYPDFPVQRRKFDDAFHALTVAEQIQTLATYADRTSGDDALPHEIAPTLAAMQKQAARYTAAPAPTPWWPAALRYCAEYLILVIGGGALRLSGTIIATIFGGMFAMYVKQLRIAEQLVYWTAEFAGERPFVIALLVFLATAGIFTSVGGLGTVIMIGTIILPILRSIGLGPVIAAGTFLIAIAMGGTLQPVNRRLWMEFYGVSATQIDSLILTMIAIYAVLGVGWTWWGTRRGLMSSFSSEPTPPAESALKTRVPAYLMAAPLLPVVLVYVLRIEEITAFTAGIVYMYICVMRQRGATRELTRALIEGAQTVMPPVLLMLGIGILLTALTTAPVQESLRPLLAAVVPQSRLGYIALFALGAPLALYRGPLNIWGMGLAVSAILLATSGLPAIAILGAILAAGLLQGISDPTNTANVWIAGFQGITVNQILRYTLLPVWLAAIVAVVLFGLRYIGA